MMFVNYGDIDFFEHGVLIDADHEDDVFRVLVCEPFPDEEDLYLFADCTVDLSDNWIDKKAVSSYCGYKELEDTALFAEACISYYGVENFSSPYDGYMFSKYEILDRLKHYFIASDNLNIEW